MDKNKKNTENRYLMVEVLLVYKYGCKTYEKYIPESIYDCNDELTECPICLEDVINKPAIKLACGHMYDIDCIITPIVNLKIMKCPKCNQPFEPCG